jgi:hypothetical protein
MNVRVLRRVVSVAILAVGLRGGLAAGSDLYYLEAEKDGRLFVFADQKVHDDWARGRSIPRAITLRAYGPRGEDVVFDGEAAVNLYNERHARWMAPTAAPVGPPAPGAQAPPPPPEAPSRPQVRWDFGTTFAFDNARVTLQNRVQFRFTDEFPPDTLQLPGTDEPGDAKPTFKVRRAKTQLEGFLLWPELTFELQMGWAGSDSGLAEGTTFSGLEDAYLDWDVSKRGLFRLRGGQFKVPFGRQEYTSSERQQFVDRSIVSGQITRSRDVGLMAWGATDQSRLAWALGAFNGNGRNRVANDNGKLQWNARLTFQPFGDVGYSEGDFESKDHPLLAVEGEFEHNDRHGVTNANDFRDKVFGLNGVFKYWGLSLFGEYFWRTRTPETGGSFDSDGFTAQAGFFLVRDRFEAAVRYASWDPTDARSDNELTELAGALNYYIRGHKLKATGDFRRLRDLGRDETAHELRLQVQFLF